MTKACLLFVLLLSGFVRGLCGQDLSETLPPVTIDAILQTKTPTVSNLRWFGKNPALVGEVTEPGASPVLRVWPLDGAPPREIRGGSLSSVSPDGGKIIFLDKGEWVIRSLNADAKELLRLPKRKDASPLRAPVWSRDRRYIAFAETYEAPLVPPDSPNTDNGVRVVDVGAQADQRQPTVDKSTITVIDLTRMNDVRRIPIVGWVTALEWGPTGTLYAVPIRDWGFNKEAPFTTVQQINIATGELKQVFRTEGFMQSIFPKVSPDGRRMALATDVDDKRWEDFVSLVLVDLGTGQSRRLTDSLYMGSIMWATDSRTVYFSARDGGWYQFYRVDLSGNITTLTHSQYMKSSMQLSPDSRRLSYIAKDGYGRVEIRVMDTDGKNDRPLVVIDDPSKRFRLGKFRRIHFPASGGIKIAAFVVYPPDFDPKKRYPVYVDVHGGGPGSFLYLFGPLTISTSQGPLEWHAIAALGYVVFVPDYRSSGEYGRGVAAARYKSGDQSGIETDVKDVESGTRWMVSQPYIDSKRVAVLGHSAGGGRVNLLLTRSSLYNAAVISDPIGAGVLPNLLSSLTGSSTGTTNWEQRFMQFLGYRLAEMPELYLGGFLFDGYKSRTPTLIIVGGDRQRGALNPLSVEVLFSILRQYDVPAKMLRYMDEGHTLRNPQAVRHAFAQIQEWLAEHLDLTLDAHGNTVFDGDRAKSRRGDSTSASRQSSTADEAYAAFEKARAAIDANLKAAPAKKLPQRQAIERSERLKQGLRAAGIKFLADQPGDPRRWHVIRWLLRYEPDFITSIGPADESDWDSFKKAIVRDEPSKAAWKKRLATLRKEFAFATDLPAEMLDEQAGIRFLLARDETYEAWEKGRPFDLVGLRSVLMTLLNLRTDSEGAAAAVADFFRSVEMAGTPAQAEAEWRSFMTHPNEKIRGLAEAKLRLVQKPVDLNFTAVDGREVDLHKLRGKVVLIEFWATWCLPCIKELPNLKKIHAAYHDKGFEVVAVSLDENKKNLLDFVAENQVPWPQHFEGLEFKSTIAVRFNVRALPAKFLLDKNGVIVSTSARGPKLEAEVKRLLGLDAAKASPGQN